MILTLIGKLTFGQFSLGELSIRNFVKFELGYVPLGGLNDLF